MYKIFAAMGAIAFVVLLVVGVGVFKEKQKASAKFEEDYIMSVAVKDAMDLTPSFDIEGHKESYKRCPYGFEVFYSTSNEEIQSRLRRIDEIDAQNRQRFRKEFDDEIAIIKEHVARAKKIEAESR